ncbi:hypothetical protein GGS26DRAFT_597045 [Hypomontagnella submonticulosa]|nr:hypothetical protein GGS26DRAFT_597045 [Hypomontagnella submonticulosa]
MPTQRMGQRDTSQATMPSFPFNKLPPELRSIVWNEALLQESSERLVLLDLQPPVIFPFKSLASPLLSVNTESRYYAVRFYDFTLPVYSLENDKYICWRDISRKRRCLDAIVRTTKDKGKLYLSPKYDIFMAGLSVMSYVKGTFVIWNRPLNYEGMPRYKNDMINHYWHCKRPSCKKSCCEPKRCLKYFTSPAFDLRPRIEKVLEVSKDDSFVKSPKILSRCSWLWKNGYNTDRQIDPQWPTDPFPNIQEYSYIPWPPIVPEEADEDRWAEHPEPCNSAVGGLLLHLAERKPGQSLLAQYKRRRELTWVDRVETKLTNWCEMRYVVDRLANDPWPCDCEGRQPCIVRNSGAVNRKPI